MTRERLERHQVWLYLAAILAGLLLGGLAPGIAGPVEALLWPALGLLLFATFVQVPLGGIAAAFRDGSFMAAVLAGNFVLVPLAVWGLLALLPADPAIRLGVLLVLLMPCTDWSITFTHLGGGDTARAIAAAPVNLLVQLLLLPAYLWLFMGDSFLELLAADRIALVFATLIVLPLAVARALQRRALGRPGSAALVRRLGALPVPLLAIVVCMIAASQVEAVLGALPVLGEVAGVFVAFLVLAVLAGLALARLLGLAPGPARALVYSLGTRNSFVVLPLSLALGPAWQAATVVIVFQSLVELFGMVAYLRLVPRLLAAERPRPG